MIQEWIDTILADDTYWDQNAFDDLMVQDAVVWPRRKDRLFLCVAFVPARRQSACSHFCTWPNRK